jgi:hypothetical protein
VEERHHFKQMVLAQMAVIMYMRIDQFLFPCKKLKSKWIKELHIKPDTETYRGQSGKKPQRYGHRGTPTEHQWFVL